MFKRFKEIKQVGVFSESNNGSAQFNKIALIYGLNTYGKSTISDIIRSLTLQDPQIMKKRKTIPQSNSTQKVTLNFLDSTENEKTISFKNNVWHIPRDFNYKIEIFDNRFIDENIFTGMAFTRSNKENFTDFILSERNVQISQKIEEKRKQSREYTRVINTIEKSIVKKLSNRIDFDDFINNKSQKKLHEVKEEIQTIQSRVIKLNDSLNRISEIKKFSLPVKLDNKLNIIQLFKEANNIFKKNIKTININVKKRMKKHIKAHFITHDKNEENWIKDGFKKYLLYEDFSTCPFCGQEIKDSSLVDLYSEYFNEELIIYFDTIQELIDDWRENVADANISQKSELSDNMHSLTNWIDVIDSPSITRIYKRIEYISKDSNIKNNEILTLYKKLLVEFKSKINEKEKTPYKKVEIIQYKELKIFDEDYILLVNRYNKLIQKVVTEIEKYKKNLTTIKLKSRLKKYNDKITELDLEELTVLLKNDCLEYRKKYKRRKILRKKITELDSLLEIEKEKFMNDYFNDINEYYKLFGSNDYEIIKHDDRLGNRPLIGIEVKYKGQSISDENISYLFSCSDRRALALSVFWAKIKKMISENINVIIILDDPVISFDDNRITNTIDLIVNELENLNQIVILTHYHDFIRSLLSRNDLSEKLSFIQILNNGKTSFLEHTDKLEFLRDEHYKTYQKIEDFINKKTNEDVSLNLRLYIEQELKLRFRKQINDNNIDTRVFKFFLIYLKDNNIIDGEKYMKLDSFRNALNPIHHTYTDMKIEDKRNFAKSLIRYIYYRL